MAYEKEKELLNKIVYCKSKEGLKVDKKEYQLLKKNVKPNIMVDNTHKKLNYSKVGSQYFVKLK